MDSSQLRGWKLVSVRIEVGNAQKSRSKWAENVGEWRVILASVVLQFCKGSGESSEVGHVQEFQDDLQLIGTGAHKDVYGLVKNSEFVWKILKSKGDVMASRREAEKFDRWNEKVEHAMAWCYGSVFCRPVVDAGYKGVSLGSVWEGNMNSPECDAVVTIMERLALDGKDFLSQRVLTLPCNQMNWNGFVEDYVKILEAILRFASRGVLTWDANLVNVGLVMRDGVWKWMFCDLDAFEEWTEPNRPIGAQVRTLWKRMSSADLSVMNHLVGKEFSPQEMETWRRLFSDLHRGISEKFEELGVSQLFRTPFLFR